MGDTLTLVVVIIVMLYGFLFMIGGSRLANRTVGGILWMPVKMTFGILGFPLRILGCLFKATMFIAIVVAIIVVATKAISI